MALEHCRLGTLAPARCPSEHRANVLRTSDIRLPAQKATSSGNRSTYFFLGRLTEPGARYQLQEAKLRDGFRLEVFLEHIAIWGTSDQRFDPLRMAVKSTLDTIVSAFAFRTRRAVSYSLESWVEAKSTEATKNVIGWFRPAGSVPPTADRRGRSAAWAKAVRLYNTMTASQANHVLALKDLNSARRDSSADAFLFAYRAIEDICRAATGMGEAQKAWAKMHNILGTTKEQIDPLTDLSQYVRHGAVDSPVVLDALTRKEKLVDIAHDIVAREFKRSFPWL